MAFTLSKKSAGLQQHTPPPSLASCNIPNVFVIPPEEEWAHLAPYCCFNAAKECKFHSSHMPDAESLDAALNALQHSQNCPPLFYRPEELEGSVTMPRRAVAGYQYDYDMEALKGVRLERKVGEEVYEALKARKDPGSLQNEEKPKRQKSLRSKASQAFKSIRIGGKGSRKNEMSGQLETESLRTSTDSRCKGLTFHQNSSVSSVSSCGSSMSTRSDMGPPSRSDTLDTASTSSSLSIGPVLRRSASGLSDASTQSKKPSLRRRLSMFSFARVFTSRNSPSTPLASTSQDDVSSISPSSPSGSSLETESLDTPIDDTDPSLDALSASDSTSDTVKYSSGLADQEPETPDVVHIEDVGHGEQTGGKVSESADGMPTREAQLDSLHFNSSISFDADHFQCSS